MCLTVKRIFFLVDFRVKYEYKECIKSLTKNTNIKINNYKIKKETHLLSVSFCKGEFSGNVKHDFSLTERGIDRLRSSLPMRHIQTASEPITHTVQLALQKRCLGRSVWLPWADFQSKSHNMSKLNQWSTNALFEYCLILKQAFYDSAGEPWQQFSELNLYLSPFKILQFNIVS